jgi:protein TonB
MSLPDVRHALTYAMAQRRLGISQQDVAPSGFVDAGSQGMLGRRTGAILGTLALEAILLILLFTLGTSDDREPVPMSNVVSFDASEEAPDTPEAPPEAKVVESRESALPRIVEVQEQPELEPVRTEAPQEQPDPKPAAPALIPLSREQMAASDISGGKAGPAKPAYGPADTGTPGDSKRVKGTAPNGEPLYAATWYREPTEGEMAGYLSTATGPGWALISCKTVANFRVENCILEAEYPRGSQMGRAVLAATWQFRVRPPRVGGRPQVGAWVRIRIEYSARR